MAGWAGPDFLFEGACMAYLASGGTKVGCWAGAVLRVMAWLCVRLEKGEEATQ